jgi:hypothetical protein
VNRRTIVALLLVTGLGAPVCRADASRFAPRSWDNGIYFDLYSSYESDDISRVVQPYGYTDTFLREKVTLFSDGYVYHPRFLQYHLSVAGALKQERYDTTYLEPTGWTHDNGAEYDARLFFLAEHPYNLELFALRYEPLYKEQASTQHSSVETSRGAYFTYRKRPYLFHSKYSVDTIDSGFASSTITRLALDGEYFQRYDNGNQLSFNGAFNPSKTSATGGLEASTDQYMVGNLIDLKVLRLNSNVVQTNYDQDSGSSGDYTNDQFSWYEILNAYFPYHLRSNVTYRQQNNTSTFPVTLSQTERELTDRNRDVQVDVIHRLYQSLDTIYTFLDTARSSSGGDTRSRYNNLNVNYSKIIERGRVLAGVTVGRGQTTSSGTTDIANEPHSGLAVPGSFTLGQQNIEPGSIAVFLRSPLPPFDNIQLIENVHYTLTAVGPTFDVFIFALPPQFAVPGTYDFFVSYSLTGGDFELASRTRGFSTSVDLFDTMLTPYYSYVAIRSEVLEGVFPGIPLDSTTNTAGVRYQRSPWRARLEYQNLQWDVSPYTSWRAEGQYVATINPTMNVYGTATYLHKYFPQGTSYEQSDAYTDETVSASGNLRKEIPSQGLSFSVGGSMSRTTGRVDSTAYALNSALTWKVGKLTLTGGANAYSTDTRGETTVDNNRVHQYYYLTIRREFF